MEEMADEDGTVHRSDIIPPPGVASAEERWLCWNYVNSSAILIAVVAYELSKGDAQNQRVRMSRRAQDRFPIWVFMMGAGTIFGSIFSAPFSNDLYQGSPCPCHWTEDFDSLTTISTMAAYRPMRYIIFVGLSSMALSSQTTCSILARRYWPRIQKMRSDGKMTNEKCFFLTAIIFGSIENYFLLGLTIFPRHIDGRIHLLFVVKFLISDLLHAVFGQLFFEKVAKLEWIDPREGLPGLRRGRIAVVASAFLLIWFGLVFSKELLKSEASLAISEYLLLLTLLSWRLGLAHFFRGEIDPHGWTRGHNAKIEQEELIKATP